MFEFLRNKIGPAAVACIIGFIAFVFIFFGVYSPRNPGMRGGGGYAALVNGETVSVREFAQSYDQRIKFYEGMMKGKIDAGLLRQLGLRKSVLDDLVRQKLLVQEAEKMGFVVADGDVASKITELPYFKKDGKFDKETYQKLLKANNYTPGKFEDMIRQDLLGQHMSQFIKERVRVSDAEISQEFLANGDQRQVEFVLLSQEDAKKRISIAASEVDNFLKDKNNLSAAQLFYNQTKFQYLKKPLKVEKQKVAKAPEFKSFEEVKHEVATALLRDRRSEDARKANRALAQEILAKANQGAGALKGFLKSKGLTQKTSDKFGSAQNFVAGIGEVPDLKQDAFREQSPLLKEAKLYETQGNFVVAWNLKVHKADLAELEKQREKLTQTIAFRKERQFYEGWMQEVQARAKIKLNDELLKETADDDSAAGAPAAAAGGPASEEM